MRRITIVLFLAFLVGCSANGPAFENVATAKNDSAIVYFFRQAAFYGSGSCPDLMIDEKEIGCLKNGGFFEVELKPGQYTILFDQGTWEPDKDLRAKIIVRAGEVHFYEYGQVFTGMFVSSSFVSISGREDFYRKTKDYSIPILMGLKKS